MARPLKKRLEYFSKDTNFYSDIKIKKLKRNYGPLGIVIYDFLLCLIYDNEGYYIEFDECYLFDISEYFGMTEKEVLKAVDTFLDLDLFNRCLYDKYKILTSTGIQERYLATMSLLKRTNIKIKSEFMLKKSSRVNSPKTIVNSEETGVNSEETPINSEITSINSEKSTQKKVSNKVINKYIYIPENLKISETDKKIFTSANWKPFVQNSKNLEQAIKFSLWFRDKIISDRLTPTKKQIQNWVTDYVILVEKKNKPPKQIAKVCEWAKNDEFWAKQINSASKLLRKDKDGYLYFDVLVSKLEDKKKDETQVVEAVNVL